MGTHLLTTTAVAAALLAATSSARAAAYGRGRARLRPLLASTSLAALLIGAATPAAFAVDCSAPVTGNVPDVTNTMPNPSCSITSATVTNNVTNTSTISPGPVGLTINTSSIGGAVVNAGQISGIRAIDLISATVSGGLTNSGTITSTGSNQNGINVQDSVLGGISNSGTITVFGGNAIALTRVNFAGDIINSSSGRIISSPEFNGAILVQGVGGTFTGSINNSGLISAGGPAIFLDGGHAITGSINNSGTITGNTGIFARGGFIQGGITNTGNITAISGTPRAIDLLFEGAATTINQRAGTITGDIRLSPLGDTLNITGGT